MNCTIISSTNINITTVVTATATTITATTATTSNTLADAIVIVASIAADGANSCVGGSFDTDRSNSN